MTSSTTGRRTSSTRGSRIFAAGVLALSALTAGCAGDRPASAQPRQPAVTAAADTDFPEVLASIGDQKITMADVRARVGDDLDQLDARYHRARHETIDRALENIVHERMLANAYTKQGKSVDELLAAEVGGSLEPNDVEIAAWYQANQARVAGRSLDQIKTQIADHIRTERRNEATDKLTQRLTAEQHVTVNLQPFRLTFDNAGAPTKGPADAPVTLVEFSDFQCPYCRVAAPTLKQVAQAFGDSVHIVYRQFPITSIHPFAFKAAEASLCANEQGKFWQLHDLMFEDQKQLAVSDLKQKARQLGLDQKKFDGCLDSGRFVEQVQKDQSEGQRCGVTGTPAMFIIGSYVEGGSVPFAKLESLIRKELSRTKARS
jgi:protein-disulfide isomerase